jgi:hypothetical protein
MGAPAYIFILHPDGTIEPIYLNSPPKFDELNTYVGGWMEEVQRAALTLDFDRKNYKIHFYCDENAKIKGGERPPANVFAMGYVGKIVAVCHDNTEDGEDPLELFWL